MSRKCRSFEKTYMQYADIGESPVNFNWWTMISTVAGALRRRVWIEQVSFQYTTNLYMALVAEPGAMAKSTTLAQGLALLRQLPEIHLGADASTWQSLVELMGSVAESFDDEHGCTYTMSAVTLKVSELGTFMNTDDKLLLDILTDLWDSPNGVWKKHTKTQGNDELPCPWINLMTATTPTWIAQRLNTHALEGGLIARCIFVYGENKARMVPYPHLVAPGNHEDLKAKLVNDLQHISTTLAGPYRLTPEAIKWGEDCYDRYYEERKTSMLMTDPSTESFLTRKFVHLHKTALVLAAMRRDERVVEKQDLIDADIALQEIQNNLPKVFHKANKVAPHSTMATMPQMMAILRQRAPMPRDALYRMLFERCALPSRDFNTMLESAVSAGQINLLKSGYSTIVNLGPTALGQDVTGEGGGNVLEGTS